MTKNNGPVELSVYEILFKYQNYKHADGANLGCYT
jgi:hypothetical protein